MGLYFKPCSVSKRIEEGKGQGKMCKLGDICEFSINGLCSVFNCEDFLIKTPKNQDKNKKT